MKIKSKLLSLLLTACLLTGLLPATAFAAETDTFTVTYKTNADVEMGTVTYEVGKKNALPITSELRSKFDAFIQRATQKGRIYVTNVLWYEDKEFTKPATFPEGQKDENYTLYCKLVLGSMSAGSVSNGAENKSYADVGGSFQPHLSISGYYTSGRDDGSEATKAIFEKKNANGQWEEVSEAYYTDKSGNTWTNMIYFSSVSDSGTYRLKDVRYTATDNNGEVLYYVNAEDTPKDEHTVTITPVELTITDVTAQDRNCDGTDTVQLSGGVLGGVLYNDNVSFTLGSGTVADKTAGSGKPVMTNITLTGADAGNYTLKQPENITVTISDDWGEPVWNWSDDGQSATVTFTCKGDTTHTESPQVIVTSEVKTPATCTEMGTTTYTAKATFNGQEYTSTKDVTDIAKLSHTLKKTDKVEATCTTDGKDAYYTCESCGKHFSDTEGKNEITKLEEYGIILATKHEAGTEWKHNETAHWNECMNNCGEKLNKAAHTFEWVIDKEATATKAGSKHEECTVCGYEKAAVEIPVTGTDTTSPKTGDNSNIALWLALLMAAGAALTGTAVYSRKRKYSR